MERSKLGMKPMGGPSQSASFALLLISMVALNSASAQIDNRFAEKIRSLSTNCSTGVKATSIVTLKGPTGANTLYDRSNYDGTGRIERGGFLLQDSVSGSEIEVDSVLETIQITYGGKITAAGDRLQTYRDIRIVVSGNLEDLIVRRSKDEQAPQVVFECKSQSACMRVSDNFETVIGVAGAVARMNNRTKIYREAGLSRTESDWQEEDKRIRSALDKHGDLRSAGKSALTAFSCTPAIGEQIISAFGRARKQ